MFNKSMIKNSGYRVIKSSSAKRNSVNNKGGFNKSRKAIVYTKEQIEKYMADKQKQ